MMLLDRIQAPEKMKDYVQTQLLPYLAKHAISLESLLYDYSFELFDSATIWGDLEPRILAVISLVQSDQSDELVLECMQRTPIPWSAELDLLVQASLSKHDSRLRTQLHDQLKLMELKKMLIRYNIKSFK